MPAHAVPAKLIKQGSPPRRHPPETCKDCGQGDERHSGAICLICKAPVEHHQDRERMAAEIAACAHLSAARLAAGLSIRPYEQWCIDQETT